MTRFSALLLAGGLALSVPAFAQDKAKAPADAKAPNAQQERMKMCNEKATGLKGDDRKDYMSACLSGKEDTKKLTASQQRMVDCNGKASGMTGDDRKKFMSECLKAKS